MKRFILLLALLSSIAQAQLKDNVLQDLPKTNLLENSGFERAQAKYTASTPAHLTVTTTTPFEGANSGVWDAAAASDTLTTNPASVPAGWANKACLATFQYSWDAGVLGYIEFKVQDGGAADLITAVVLTPTESGKWYEASAAFPCPSSGTVAIKLEATADAAAIKLDKLWLGEDYRIGETNHVILESPKVISGSVTNLTTNINVQGGTTQRMGNRQLVEGSIQFTGANTDGPVEINLRPGTTVDVSNIPALNAPTAGTDRVKLHGSWHMIDRGTGTFYSGEVTYDVGDDKIYLVLGSPTTGPIIDTLNNRPITIAVDDVISWSFDVPITEWAGTGTTNTTTLQTQGWKIDSKINAATNENDMLGLVSDSLGLFSIIQKSNNDMALVNRDVVARITCDGGNLATGLTCSTGDESLGIDFDQPYGGKFEVCFSGNHIGQVTAGQLDQRFIVRETGNANDTIVDDTVGEAATVGHEDEGTAITGLNNWRVCSEFNWPAAARRTVKLLESTATNPTVVINRLNLVESSGLHEAITVTVRPLTQNFPQAVALIGDEYERGRVMVREGSTHNGIVVNVTPTGMDTINTTGDATWLRPFSMLDESGVERWFLELSISARITSDITANSTFTINGIDFSDTDNTHFTALAAAISRSGGGIRVAEGFIVHSTDTITVENADSGLGYNRAAVQGTIPLESKPTWVP